MLPLCLLTDCKPARSCAACFLDSARLSARRGCIGCQCVHRCGVDEVLSNKFFGVWSRCAAPWPPARVSPCRLSPRRVPPRLNRVLHRSRFNSLLVCAARLPVSSRCSPSAASRAKKWPSAMDGGMLTKCTALLRWEG